MFQLHAEPDFWKEYKCSTSETLGRGAFGMVWEVVHSRTDEHFAVKIMCKDRDQNEEVAFAEVKALKNLSHPNIIRLHAAYEAPDVYFIVTELCVQPELMNPWNAWQLASLLSSLSARSINADSVAKQTVTKLLLAVEYMHSMQYVHCDIKHENVLIALNGVPMQLDIRLIDFGLAQKLDHEDQLLTEVCGTRAYFAPEIIAVDRGLCRGFSKPVDLWGIGLFTFFILCDEHLFKRRSRRDTEAAISEHAWSFPERPTVSNEATPAEQVAN